MNYKQIPLGINKQKRILLLARVFPPRVGGIENYIYNVSHRLASYHDLTVVTPTEPGDQAFDALQNFKIVRTPRLPFIRNRFRTPLLGMLFFSLREAFRFKPHQIHCDQVDSAFLAWLMTVWSGIPYIVYSHGMEISEGKLKTPKKIVLGDADAVIANSKDTHRKLDQILSVPKEHIHIIPPGVDTSRFNTQLDGTQIRRMHGLVGKKIILTVGRMSRTRSKGQDTVIRALPRILAQVPEAIYLLVGSGDGRLELEVLAQQLGVREKVVFVGRVSNDELPEYYAASDVFVMLSRDRQTKQGGVLGEGFGIVFLEAGACGKPVVGSNSGGIPDAVVDGLTGRLVDPNDQDSAEEAIISLLRDEALAQRLGEQGRLRVEESYTWDETAKRMDKVIAVIDEGTPLSKGLSS